MTSNFSTTETVALGEIASVQIGVTRRSGLRRSNDSTRKYENSINDFDSKIQLVSMGNLRAFATPHSNSAPSSDSPTIADNKEIAISERVASLQSGDIVFSSRGLIMDATLVPPDIGKAILISPLFRIRLKSTSAVTSKYLHWYMNQPIAQRFFHKYTEGSSLQMVSRRNLVELPIPLVPLESQKKIVRLFELQIKEEELTLRILQNRAKLIKQSFADLISSNTQKEKLIINKEQTS